jgi:hypothetical protein
MSLTTVLSVNVRPDSFATYEAQVHAVAERAVSKKEPFEWTAHQVMAGRLGTIHFVSQAPTWAALAAREPIEVLIRRLMGDTEGTRILEQLGACIASEQYTIGQERADLAYPPPASEPHKPMGVVTLFRTRPGGQDALEELIRKAAQAIPAVKDPRRFRAFQTVIGNVGTYWVVSPLDSLADLDAMLPPGELLQRAFGAEGALIHRNALEQIEHTERSLTALRPELSNGAWVPSFIARVAKQASAHRPAH